MDALLDQMITTSILMHLHQDMLTIPDHPLFSAGARVILSQSPDAAFSGPRVVHRTQPCIMMFRTAGRSLGVRVTSVLLTAPITVESVTVDHDDEDEAECLHLCSSRIQRATAHRPASVYSNSDADEAIHSIHKYRHRR